MHPHQHAEADPGCTPVRDTADRAATARLALGDEAALAELLHMYWAPIVTYAAVYTSDPDAAQDIAQEAFARLWHQRGRWIAGEPARPFLYRVAHNLACNEQRHQLVHAQWERAERSRSPVTSQSAAQLYEADVLDEEIRHAISALPERRRQVFILARFDGRSHREIAELMEISVQTVANQMSAALAHLRSALEPFMDEPGAGTAKISRLRHG